MADHWTAPEPQPARASVARRALLYLCPFLCLLGVLVALLYSQEIRHAHGLHIVEGQHIVDMQSDAIERAFRTVRSDLRYLHEKAARARFLTTGPGRAELERDYLLFAKERGVYHQVRLLDASGREVVRVNHDQRGTRLVAPAELQAKGDRYYFRETWRLEPGQVFVSRFDLNVEHGRMDVPWTPVIRFAAVLVGDDGRKRGVLVLNYLGSDLLAELERLAERSPGDVLLLDAEGFYLAGVPPARAWGFLFGRDEDRLGADHAEAWQRIAAGESGRVSTDEGLFTFVNITPTTVAGPLRVVSFIPREHTESEAGRLLGRLAWVAASAALVIAVLAFYVARARELHQIQERCITESEHRLRALSMELLGAQERERRTIARDLHDELGQIVTAITLHLQRAAKGEPGERRDTAIAQAASAASTLMSRVHDIASRIRPALLDDLGLEDAVHSHLADFERTTGVTVDADVRVRPETLEPEAAENLYRILQEALNNVSNHASAGAVRVELRVDASAARLVVHDDGVGCDPTGLSTERLGLLGMRERAELMGGRFTLTSAPGAGARVEVEIPRRAG